jgi:hypothetical protein
VIPSASRVWRKVVGASGNLPVFHSMLPASAMACLSHAMRRRVSAISGARNRLPGIEAACFGSRTAILISLAARPKAGDADAEKGD